MTSDIYASISGMGIIKSEDNGNTWNEFLLKNYTVNVLKKSLQDNYLYAGAFNGLWRINLEESKNKKLLTGPEVIGVQDLLIIPGNQNEIYIGTIFGCFLSIDNGITWAAASTGLGNDTFISKLAFSEIEGDTVIFAGTEGGVYKARAKDMKWKPAGLNGKAVRGLIADTDNNNLYCAADSDGFHISCDWGENWVQIKKGISDIPLCCIEQNGANPDILYAGSFKQGVFISENRGLTWKKLETGLLNDVILTVKTDKEIPGLVIVSTYENGVFVSEDGCVSWKYSGWSDRNIIGVSNFCFSH